MVPEAAWTRRIRLLAVSAMYRSPAEFKATSWGVLSRAVAAEPGRAAPRHRGDDPGRGRDFPCLVVPGVGDVEIPVRCDVDVLRLLELRRRRLPAVARIPGGPVPGDGRDHAGEDVHLPD